MVTPGKREGRFYVFQFRLSRTERETMEKLAAKQKLTLSDYARKAVTGVIKEARA